MARIKYLQRRLYDVLSNKPRILLLVVFIIILLVILHFFEFFILLGSPSPCPPECCSNLGSACMACEPIDVVYTWVNGSDPLLQQEMGKYAEAGDLNEDLNKQRYDDKDELKYSLRSLEKYASWVRHVYIVTADQLPRWLDVRSSRVTVISHADIMTPQAMPVFSSPNIECAIHKIPGLSERFLYFNDDMFLGQPLYLSDLYTQTDGYEVYTAWNVPDCAQNCPWSFLGDSSCDSACDNPECDFDGGDCTEEGKTRNYGNIHHLDYLGDYKDSAFFDEDDKPDYMDLPEGLNQYPGLTEPKLDSKFYQAPQHEDQKLLNDILMRKNEDSVEVGHKIVRRDVENDPMKGFAGSDAKLDSNKNEGTSVSLRDLRKINLNNDSSQFDGFVVSNDKKRQLNESIRTYEEKRGKIEGNLQEDMKNYDSKIALKKHDTKTRRKTVTLKREADFSGEVKAQEAILSYGKLDKDVKVNLTLENNARMKRELVREENRKNFRKLRNFKRGGERNKLNLNASHKFDTNNNAIFNSNDSNVDKLKNNISLSKILNEKDKNLSVAVDHYNDKYLKTDKHLRQHKKRSFDDLHADVVDPESYKQNGDSRKLDTYGKSLIYTNKVFNKVYGFQSRKVPAHVPLFLEKKVIVAMQEKFKEYVDITKENKFRRPNDFQFAFSYFHFLMSETEELTVEEIFDLYDTDKSGTWSDREVRTVLVKARGLPLTAAAVQAMEQAARACDKDEYRAHPTPHNERYMHSEMPTLTKALVSECGGLRGLLRTLSVSHTERRARPRSSSQRASFTMLVSNVSKAVNALDEIRRDTKKFICINDDLDPDSEEENVIVRMLLQELYESLLPAPSQFELPPGVANRFLHLSELKEWQANRAVAWRVLGVCALVLLLLTLYFCCRGTCPSHHA